MSGIVFLIISLGVLLITFIAHIALRFSVRNFNSKKKKLNEKLIYSASD
jgi:hypothetical protein